MSLLARLIVWGGALFISAVFVDSLRFKFTGHLTPKHIFTTLRDWSGIELFYPAGPWIIGLGELTASLLLIGVPLILLISRKPSLIAASQVCGALIAFAIMSGAIVFHLFSPLGVETPTKWEGGVAVAHSPALFYSACASWAFSIAILAIRRNAIRRKR